MKKLRSILIKVALAIIILILVLGGVVGFIFRFYLPITVANQSFPQTKGEIKLSGLNQPVEIYRDDMGIPQVYASTLHDLFFAQGYIHAQERFWQMDFWRHIGSGSLSEMFGESQLDTDAFLRTLGWRQLAEEEYAGLSGESRAILTAYSEGVNAYLNDHHGSQLSLEYAILKILAPDYQIAPWTPIHTLTWAKAMAWDLRGNMEEEIQRAILLRSLDSTLVDFLFPPYPKDHPLIVPQIGGGLSPSVNANAKHPELFSIYTDANLSFTVASAHIKRLDKILGTGQGLGSNSWVIAGTRTTSGKPILANDPHLGIQMPSIWYQIGLHCHPKTSECPYEVSGFSFAGVPGVVIGHNDHIAWGFTNVGPDVIDLYIEKVNPQNPNQYEVNGKWVDFETRQESIHIAGGKTKTITVRISRHGPIISDTYGPLKDTVDPKEKAAQPFREKAGIPLPEQYAIAMRWTALQPSAVFEAIWGFDKAQSWSEFRQAASGFAVPAQNLVYADVDGNIGYQMPGLIPIRKNGDGRLPVPGWNDDYEWTGFIPYDELPYSLNPPSGYIVTANNRVSPWDYPYWITYDWDYGFRAQRIVTMIEQTTQKIDLATIQIMQGDDYDASAAMIVPVLMHTPLNDPHLEEVRLLLQDWDFQAKGDSAAAALYEVFWSHLLQDTFADDLPKEFAPEGGDRWFEVLRNLITQKESFWWDNQTTSMKTETRDDIFNQAFLEAVGELEKKQGRNPSQWKWGKLHTATFRNSSLGESGIPPLESLFNRGPFETSGGSSIVNATGWNSSKGYQVNWLPSMRMIVDLSNLDASLSVHTTGESGHVNHEHYIDMANLWRTIQYYPMWWDKESVMSHAKEHLRLIP